MTRPPRRSLHDDIDTSLVEFLAVVVPDMDSLHALADAMVTMVDQSSIRILDLVVVTRDRTSDEITVVELDAVEGLAGSVHLDPAGGDLLSDNDISLASTALMPGSVCLMVLVEDRWADSLSSAAQQAGGSIIGGQRIPRARIATALAESPFRIIHSRGQSRSRGRDSPAPG
jgi:hypothetical protein